MNSNNVLEYKNYHTKVEYSAEDQVLYGKIEGIRDLVTFECESVFEVEAAFHEAVDDYLAFCAEKGKDPDKTYNGVFNVRIDPELHRTVALTADREGKPLNTYVREAIQEKVEGRSRTEVHLHIEQPKLAGYAFDDSMRPEARVRGISYGAKS